MSDLSDAIRHWLARFGRLSLPVGTAEHDDDVDGRLTTLEQRQAEIKARLRILEKQSNPRGIGFD